MPKTSEIEFYGLAMKVADELKVRAMNGTLKGFGIVILDSKTGIDVDFACHTPGVQINLLGGMTMLEHTIVCDLESAVEEDDAPREDIVLNVVSGGKAH